MTISDVNRPQTDRKLTLIGLFAASTAYALLLSTKKGKEWTDEQTWSTVAVGVMMTTGFIALEDRKAANLNFIYFFVAGIPIIARSLILQFNEWQAAIRKFGGIS